MRSTIVPAQITTVEDKIAGDLGITQILLLTMPVFGSSTLFILLPPFFAYAFYKIVLIVCFAIISCLLAIRVKERIILSWLIVIAKYMLRPKYHVFDKNSMYLRDSDFTVATTKQESAKPKIVPGPLLKRPKPSELMWLKELASKPDAQLHFKVNRKGELSVHFTEI